MKYTGVLLLTGLLFLGCKKYPKHSFISETVQYKTISGIDPERNQLDVYHFGDQQTRPVLFWVHGGAWAIGDKTSQLDTKLDWAYEKGYILVATNYRLSDEDVPQSDTSRVETPDHIIDVADAFAWTYNNIEQYGGDPNRIVIFGHSAGAHLVALLGADTSLLTSRSLPLDAIKGVGCFDTQAYNVVEMMNDDPSDIYINAFSNDPQKWEAASPQLMLSPTPTLPPYFIITRGSDKRMERADAFHQALLSNGNSSQLIDASNYSHGKVNDKIGDPKDKKFMDKFETFLNEAFQ